jgi:aminoglycoside phosphotransferase (APT) family kinase protein
MSFSIDHLAAMDLEPAVRAALTRRASYPTSTPYLPKSEAEVARALGSFFASKLPGAQVDGVYRLGGGCSKEQFGFTLKDGKAEQRCVLRMDPAISAIENDRGREFRLLQALDGYLPVPQALWIDADGSSLGRPAYIMKLIDGVTDISGDVSANFASKIDARAFARLNARLTDQFLDNMDKMQRFDWRMLDPLDYAPPLADPQQAARWQVNWWAGVWQQDLVVHLPVMAAAELWMMDNLPSCAEGDLVLLHGDYRTGNYMFDPQTGDFNAILDWEAAHVGDFHEDLGMLMPTALGTWVDGQFLISGLMPRDQFIARFERLTGRTVNLETLRFYEVLACYKCASICLGSTLSVIQSQQNHQDTHLAWLADAGSAFVLDMCRLIEAAAFLPDALSRQSA